MPVTFNKYFHVVSLSYICVVYSILIRLSYCLDISLLNILEEYESDMIRFLTYNFCFITLTPVYEQFMGSKLPHNHLTSRLETVTAVSTSYKRKDRRFSLVRKLNNNVDLICV